MRITSIAVHQRELPVVGGEYAMGGNTVVSLDTTLVQVATDVGVVSWGETCPLGTRYQPHHARGARAAIAELAPALMGADPLRVLDAGRRMDEALAGHAYAKAPLEVALWDILARAHDTRLCDLLGGASGDTVPAYAVIGLEPPEAAAEHALALQAQGYRRIQLKVGGRGLDEDIAAVRAVDRALRPGVALVADANRAWSVPDAMLASAACRDVRMALEQPCASYEEMASLRGRLAHPVILDEIVESPEVAMRAIVEGVADGFGLKVSRVGGVGPMLAIRDMCRARRVGHTCDDAWGGDIAAATCVHIAATVEPSLLAGVWIAAPYIAEHLDPDHRVVADAGRIAVPSGPGLGVDPGVRSWPDPFALTRPEPGLAWRTRRARGRPSVRAPTHDECVRRPATPQVDGCMERSPMLPMAQAAYVANGAARSSSSTVTPRPGRLEPRRLRRATRLVRTTSSSALCRPAFGRPCVALRDL